MRACLDFSFECTTDSDCPASPQGTYKGVCLGSADGLAPGDFLYHHGYWPYSESLTRYTCW